MRNKGCVISIAVLLTLICVFYLSFTFVVNIGNQQKDEIKANNTEVEAKKLIQELDTTPNYYLGYTLDDCKEYALNLGLDLQGGMRVILGVNMPEMIKNLAGEENSNNTEFLQAIEKAKKNTEGNPDKFLEELAKEYGEQDFCKLFKKRYKGLDETTNTAVVIDSINASAEKAIDPSLELIRSRIDRFGVVQPNIQRITGQQQIMVELAGVKEKESITKLLEGNAKLEFWEVFLIQQECSDLPITLQNIKDNTIGTKDAKTAEKADEEDDLANTANKAVGAANLEETADNNVTVDEKATTEENSEVAQNAENETETEKADEKEEKSDQTKETKADKASNPLSILTIQPNGCVVGTTTSMDNKEKAAVISYLEEENQKKNFDNKIRFRWSAKTNEEGLYELYVLKATNDGKASMHESGMVTNASSDFDEQGHPSVSMQMDDEAARQWSELTGKNVGRPVAIVMDDVVYSAPRVNGQIDGGRSQITGNFTLNDTKELVAVLGTGKMDAPFEIVSADVVGSSLGAASITAGIMSFIIAFIILMVYMCMMYGLKPGMIANTALVLNLFFTLGILASFNATITLAGIAGMVLTLGMAVDANVLIYERIKEELRGGKKMKQAIAAGYKNAFSAIIDSNVTSVLTGIILAVFGTGPVRGFAITLIIGIACSFFTAVLLTRVVYEYKVNRDKWLNLTFTTGISKNLMQNTKYKFMSSYKTSFAIFGALVIAGVISLAVRGLSLSIDFTGGRTYKVYFSNENVNVDDVRTALQANFNNADPENSVNTSVISISGANSETGISITTNFKNVPGTEYDVEAQNIIYETLKNQKLLDKNISFEKFINPNNDKDCINSQSRVGGSISDDITRKAFISVALAILAIFIYILIRFRNVAYSIGSIAALAVDTFLIIATYSICYGWIGFTIDIDQIFIGAVLTAIGYSINDKVVIFDRIRENFQLYPKRDRQRLFNESLNSTLARTINTSVSTLIVLLVLFIFGGDAIRSFAFAMILGVVYGTCSSLFIAAPTAYLVMGGKIKEAEEPTAVPAKA